MSDASVATHGNWYQPPANFIKRNPVTLLFPIVAAGAAMFGPAGGTALCLLSAGTFFYYGRKAKSAAARSWLALPMIVSVGGAMMLGGYSMLAYAQRSQPSDASAPVTVAISNKAEEIKSRHDLHDGQVFNLTATVNDFQPFSWHTVNRDVPISLKLEDYQGNPSTDQYFKLLG